MQFLCFLEERVEQLRFCTFCFGQNKFLFGQHVEVHVREIQLLNTLCPQVIVSSFVSRATGCCRRHRVSRLDRSASARHKCLNICNTTQTMFLLEYSVLEFATSKFFSNVIT